MVVKNQYSCRVQQSSLSFRNQSSRFTALRLFCSAPAYGSLNSPACSCVSIILSLRRGEQKRQKSDGMVRTIEIRTAAVARLLLGFYVVASAFASHAVSPLVT